jgi:AI-2 transport protein TqsA
MRGAVSIVSPFLTALFIAALLTPIYRWSKKRMSNALALLLSFGVLLLIMLLVTLLIGNSMVKMTTTLAEYNEKFSQRQAELEAMIAQVGLTETLKQYLATFDPAVLVQVLGIVVSAITSVLSNAFLIIFMTLFILVGGPGLKASITQSFGPDHLLTRKMTTLLVSVIRYFGIRSLVNLIVAISTGIMLWLCGIDYAGLWAVLIFFLSYLPYIGAVISMIPPVLLAYAESGLPLAIFIIIMAIIINSITENVLSPIMIGKTLSVPPMVVFLSMVLWVFILGGGGALVAMPITVGLILFLSSFEETSQFAQILGNVPESA